MDIIVGTNVDLIAPYPLREIKRAYGWMHCYRSIIESDESPKTLEEFEAYMAQFLGVCTSFGIIDKNHITNVKHEAPLVGILILEPGGLHNGYWHVATSRRAWGTGLVDEAAKLGFQWAFENFPALTRLSANIYDRNFPAQNLAKRLGFKREGVLEDMFVLDAQPRNMVHYGLTRRSWEQEARNTSVDVHVIS